jgi:NAD-dependent deacetylase
MTGAGVSAESGIPTFRDSNGLWHNHAVEAVASLDGFAADPGLVWEFYSERRAGASASKPNSGHVALAALERRLGDRFLLATQNVDGLHRDAGNTRIVELHGNLFRSRCSCCERAPFEDRDVYTRMELPACSRCHARGERALLRPHIVWFGEMLDPADLLQVREFMQKAATGRFVFLAVGTSGVVYPAAGLVESATTLGADTWLVNAEPPANAGQFRHFVQGLSGVLLPSLLSE